MPFNEEQFDRCSLWLATKLGRPVTQYDLVKFHVMTDIYHVLQYGRPVIGGALVKWKFGPVVKPAYFRLTSQANRFEQGKTVIGPLAVEAGRSNVYKFTPAQGASVDEDEFSQSEIEAMEAALQIVRLSFAKSQGFFHEPMASFVGRVWTDAEFDKPIDWNSIVDAYDAQFNTNHQHIKALLALGV